MDDDDDHNNTTTDDQAVVVSNDETSPLIDDDSESTSSRRKRRCKRIVLLVFVGLAAIVGAAVLVIYMKGPKIIQRMLNDATFNYTLLSMRNAGTSSFRLVTNGTIIHSSTQFHATIHHPVITFLYTMPNSSDAEQLEIGVFTAPDIVVPPHTDQQPFNVNATLTITNKTNFDAFGAAMIKSTNVSCMLVSSSIRVSVIIESWLPTLEFHHLKLDTPVTLEGFSNLPHVNLGVFNVELNDDDIPEVTLHVDVINPSYVSIVPLGNIVLDMYDATVAADNLLGSITGDSVRLLSGDNRLGLKGPLNLDAQPAIERVFNGFLCGQVMELVATGAKDRVADSIPLYIPLLHDMHLATHLVPIKWPMGIQNILELKHAALLKWILSGFKTMVVPTTFMMHNPFTAPIQVTTMHLTIGYYNTTIGTLHTTVDSDGHPLYMELPGNHTIWSPTVPITLDTVKEDDKAMVASLVQLLLSKSGVAPIELTGYLTLHLGKLTVNADYCDVIPTCTQARKDKCAEWVAKNPTWPID